MDEITGFYNRKDPDPIQFFKFYKQTWIAQKQQIHPKIEYFLFLLPSPTRQWMVKKDHQQELPQKIYCRVHETRKKTKKRKIQRKKRQTE